MTEAALLSAIQGRFPAADARAKCDMPAVQIAPADLVALAQFLRDDPALQFAQMLTHTAIDWLEEGRFELVYVLQSLHSGQRLLLSVSLPRAEPVAPSVSAVWPIAEWLEREVYDMFGVLYTNHSDLRRILLDDDWVGFPLRKDYTDSFMLERPS